MWGSDNLPCPSAAAMNTEIRAPVLDRLTPSPNRFYAFIVFALAFEIVLLSRVSAGSSFLTVMLFAWCVVIQVFSAIRIFRPIAIFEVTNTGIHFAVGTRARSEFFLPWSRVRAIFLVRTTRNHQAVGFDVIEDADFRAPACKLLHPRLDPQAPSMTMALEFAPWAYEGDAADWVGRLQAYFREHAGPHNITMYA